MPDNPTPQDWKPEELEPVARGLGLTNRLAGAVLTAAIESGLVVRAEEHRVLAERCDRWRREAFDCWVVSGADTDGSGPEHLQPGWALESVRELRADYDECPTPEDLANAQAQVRRTRESHRGMVEELAEARAVIVAEQEEAMQAGVDKALSLMHGSAYVGGPSEREAWRGVLDALGPFETQHTGQHPREDAHAT